MTAGLHAAAGLDHELAVPFVADDGPQGRPNSSAGGFRPQGAVAVEQRLRALWHTSLEALLVVDDERRYVCVNHPAAELLGAPTERVVGRRIEDFTARENWPVLDSLWAEFKADREQHGAYEVLRADGSRSMVEYRATWNFGPGQHLIVAREMGGRRSKPRDAGRWSRAARPTLTARERQVLQLAADGRSLREIAEALHLSPGTVRSHLQRIHKKLGVRDRASAVAVALRLGLID